LLIEEVEMAVEKIGEKYKCNVCGNEIVVTKVGGGTLVCCGQDMELMEFKTPEVINLPDSGG
jgi:desulfoferrodoxin-like iron-binding protein